MPYLVSNMRLSTNQSRNKKWHSTETSLIHTTNAILGAIDQKKTTAVVLLDMSKAFDSINYSIFQDKLQDISASTSALRWFTSCLSERNQVVRINSTLLDVLPLTSSIPQGSILGPLLFTIYVNDLLTVPKNCSSDYVDDTKLYMSFGVHDCKNAVAAMNEDLIRFHDWCFGNCLLINPEKTKLIIYGSRQTTERLPQFHLSLLGKELVPTQSVKQYDV